MNTWCIHCEKGKGCRIYGTPEKPPSCTEYNCLWHSLQTVKNPSLKLSERFRPDHTKVVVDIPGNLPYKAAIFWMDPSYPAAMHSKENRFLVETLGREYVVIEARGRKRKILALDPKGAARMIELGYSPDAVGKEWEV